jgi:hypothetical protein
MGELGGRGHEPIERLIEQIRSQPKISFETYFPPKTKERVQNRRLQVLLLFVVSILIWSAVGYATWATLSALVR